MPLKKIPDTFSSFIFSWKGLAQGCQIWPISKNFRHFLTALPIKKCISPFCKIRPFFRFVTVKLSFKYFVFLDGIHVIHCYSNTMALQPFVALKYVVMI